MDKLKVHRFIYIVLIVYFSFFFLRKINLITADLGRHITNGEVFVKQGKVVSTNFYSYTQPDFPVVTHHWLSGVVFYLVQTAAGFSGLSIFYILLSGLTVFFFFKTAEENTNLPTALLVAVLLIPLMANRKEIRPEGFSYLFMGIYYYLLHLFIKNKLKYKILVPVILILQILWVNLHLFFFMGIMITGVFAFAEFIKRFVLKRKNRFNQLLILVGLSVLVSLINPYFLKGLLEPLNILKEYGYMIVENQTVFFMQKRRSSFEYFYFELFSVLFLVSGATILFSKRRVTYLASVLLAFVFTVLGYRAIRGIPIFAFFMVPVAAIYLNEYLELKKSKFINWALAGLIMFTFVPGHEFSIFNRGTGAGLASQINASAEFVKRNNIEGPIFNNYDIGGYLIYHFYPEKKVFVDNRPEAYSVSFFEDTYVPMQEDEQVWKQVTEEYDFNIIYFYRRDATPWAQPFLIERIEDPNWVPVYVDPYVLILVRNNEQNLDIINNHQLPKEMFVVT